MTLLHGTKHSALNPPQSYTEKVLNIAPANLIGYWPLGEKSLVNAHNAQGLGRDGTYNSAVNTWPWGDGIGDGNTAPQLDGANDYIDAYSAALNTAFNGQEFSILVWMRVANAGVWADATFRRVIEFEVDVNNRIKLHTANVANRITVIYSSGGTHLTNTVNGVTSLDSIAWLITASATDDEFITCLNGVQQGAAINGLGAWAGNLAVAGTLIGAETNVPTNSFEGSIAHVAIWSGYPGGILTPAQALDLASL